MKAKLAAAPQADIAALFKTVGMTLISTVGGASGPLYGTLFLQLATKAAGKSALSVADWAACLEAGLAGVVMRGKAELGDKTMVDALAPRSDGAEDRDRRAAGRARHLRCGGRRPACKRRRR